MDTNVGTSLKTSDLAFDFKNPRLTEFNLTPTTSEAEVVRVLWETMDVKELVMSIAASGFFQHEPIIVAHEDGQNVVIEGNRRLAAVKVLLDPQLAKEIDADVPKISRSSRDALDTLPVLMDTRESAWRYLGFKHVNGPAKWTSYAKARYISDVHRVFGIKLEEIAGQIGDTHRTVQRLFRGLMVIEQAEGLGIFSRDDRWRSHFSFSHLYTGLSYPGISDFIGLRPETEEQLEPVPTEKKDELRELCLWLYGSKKERIPPVIETQNPHLRQLNSVLEHREAIAVLRGRHGLATAYESSRPSSTVFERSLLDAKTHLQKARGMLSTGYDGSNELLAVANDVVVLASDLHSEMARKRNRGKTASATEGG